MEGNVKKGLKISARQVAKATSGKLTGDKSIMINAVSTDSRSIGKGDLFVAITGGTFDGHDYVDAAFERGACGAVVKKGYKLPDPLKDVAMTIEVCDTLKAYQDIAALNRAKNSATVVAITGSVGKTTTKEMLKSILEMSGDDVVISEKNYNNQIGVPMTLLNIRKEHKTAVVEVGISEPNDMDSLAEITNPDIAVVTNAGSSHLEFLKSVDNVAREKMKLAENVREGGTLIFNRDDLRLLRDSAGKDVTRFTYGFNPGADVICTDCEDVDLGESLLTISLKGETVKITLKVNGRHNAYNALAALSVATTLNIPLKEIIAGLEMFTPKDMRSEQLHLADDILLINDAYNANPDSMIASLNMFSGIKNRQRKIVILGVMSELGEFSLKAHKDIGIVAGRSGIDKLFLYGDEMLAAEESAKECGMDEGDIFWSNDLDSLFEKLLATIQKGDWMLIKGSRSNRLELLVELLINKIGSHKVN